jgi:ubiquitin carboxyl-terminal hydrolase 4/11/15
VEIDKHSSIKTLKEYVGKRFNIDISRLHAVEIYKYRFYKAYQDNKDVSSEIQSNDDVAIFELEAPPTNWPAPKKQKRKFPSMLSFGLNSDEDEDPPNWDEPEAAKLSESMLVPVLIRVAREPLTTGRYTYSPWSLVNSPFFITINAKESRDIDAILRKLLDKISMLTTYNLWQDMDGVSESSGERSSERDSDRLVTIDEDGDSSGDSKIHVQSVDGEEGMLDVSMRDTSQVDGDETQDSTTESRRQHPDILDPKTFIPPLLRNMFEMKFFRGSEMVPLGWNSIDETKSYNTIESRIPPRHSPSPPADSPSVADMNQGSGDGSSEAESEGDINNVPDLSNNTEWSQSNLTSSDEDDSSPPERIPFRPSAYRNQKFSGRGKGRGGRRNMKTYSKKGRYRVQTDGTDESETTVCDDGPLIRLGEGIVLDWRADAWDTIFGSRHESDEMRGMPTWEDPPMFLDKELQMRRLVRQSRRKKGVTLSDCLDEFGKEEILSENDAWYCPRCKQHRRASKKFELWKTPDILVIHLKRFSASRNFRDKLDVLVDFPIQNLDLGSRVMTKEEGKSDIYDLIAVDNHYGGLGGGHYTAFAKNFFDGEWYEYNGEF